MTPSNPYSQYEDPLTPAIKQLAPGDVIETVPKSPVKSSTYWGLVVLIVTWATKRFLPAKFQQDIPVFLEIAATLIGGALVVYGRWNATRPLGFSNLTKMTIKSLLLPLILFLHLTGCTALAPTSLPPKKQLIVATDSYTTTLEFFTAAGKAGWISKEFALQSIEPARAAAAAALDKMEAAVDANSGTGLFSDFTKALSVFNEAYSAYLDKRLEVQKRQQVKPQGPPPTLTPTQTPTQSPTDTPSLPLPLRPADIPTTLPEPQID